MCPCYTLPALHCATYTHTPSHTCTHTCTHIYTHIYTPHTSHHTHHTTHITPLASHHSHHTTHHTHHTSRMYLWQVIHLSCFYRHPNENIREFIEYLSNKIFLLIPKNVNSILCGDCNMNLYSPLHLTSIDEFVNSLSGQGYFPLILKPTRL